MFYMAVSDEDWKAFMDSTELDPDEVETDDELEDEPDDQEEDDPKADPKKSKKDEEEDPDDPEEDDDSEEEDEDDPEEDDDPAKKKGGDDDYKPRLKQFLNDDGTLNAKSIEDAYVESGKQAVQLNSDLRQSREDYTELLGAIKANPEAAKLLFGEDGAKKLAENSNIPKGGTPGGNGGNDVDLSSHPLFKHLEAQMNNASRKEYEEFVDAHPEAVTDPKKAELIGEFLKVHGEMYRRTHNGEIPSMKDSLEAAYRYHGWDTEIKSKEELATAAKKTAATRKNGGAKKTATKKEVSKGEEFFARKLGVTLKK